MNKDLNDNSKNETTLFKILFLQSKSKNFLRKIKEKAIPGNKSIKILEYFLSNRINQYYVPTF